MECILLKECWLIHVGAKKKFIPTVDYQELLLFFSGKILKFTLGVHWGFLVARGAHFGQESCEISLRWFCEATSDTIGPVKKGLFIMLIESGLKGNLYTESGRFMSLVLQQHKMKLEQIPII